MQAEGATNCGRTFKGSFSGMKFGVLLEWIIIIRLECQNQNRMTIALSGLPQAGTLELLNMYCFGYLDKR